MSHRRVCHWCFHHVLTSSVIHCWPASWQHGIFFFVLVGGRGAGEDEERRKATYACILASYHLTARGYICTSLRIFQVTNATFRPRLFSSSTYLYTVYLESFSKPSRKSRKHFQNCVFGWHAMANFVQNSPSLGIFKSSRILFVYVSPLFFICKQLR